MIGKGGGLWAQTRQALCARIMHGSKQSKQARVCKSSRILIGKGGRLWAKTRQALCSRIMHGSERSRQGFVKIEAGGEGGGGSGPKRSTHYARGLCMARSGAGSPARVEQNNCSAARSKFCSAAAEQKMLGRAHQDSLCPAEQFLFGCC